MTFLQITQIGLGIGGGSGLELSLTYIPSTPPPILRMNHLPTFCLHLLYFHLCSGTIVDIPGAL